MRTVITGGAGFIGSHLTDHLLGMGDSVTVLDDFSTGSRANLVEAARNPQFRLVEGSVLDRGLVHEVVAGSDRVFHLAAAVGVFGMANVPFVYWSVNVWRTIHPTTNVVRSLDPAMRLPFFWCAAAFVLLYVALLLTRLRLEQSRMALEAAYAEIED